MAADAPSRTGSNLAAWTPRRRSARGARSRRFDPRPVERETLEELLELARWAPNHNLTNPWRFRVVGPRALDRLKAAAGELAVRKAPAGADPGELARVAAAKLDRAPTLVVCSVKRSRRSGPGRGGPARRARWPPTSCCWARTRAGWRATGARPACCARRPGCDAVGLPDDERFVGLLYLGPREAVGRRRRTANRSSTTRTLSSTEGRTVWEMGRSPTPTSTSRPQRVKELVDGRRGPARRHSRALRVGGGPHRRRRPHRARAPTPAAPMRSTRTSR